MMKKVLTRFFILAAFTSMAMGCTKPEMTEFKLSADSFSFDAEGTQEYTIDVSSVVGWNVGGASEWLKIVNQTETSVTLKAEKNETLQPRKTTLNFYIPGYTQGVSIDQLAGEGRYFKYNNYYAAMAPMVVSNDGHYAAGVLSEVQMTGTYKYWPVIIDLWTGKRTQYDELSASSIAVGITNDGVLYMRSKGLSFVPGFFLEDGVLHTLETTDDCTGISSIQSVSSDGSVIVGYGHVAQGPYFGVIWENHVPRRIESPAQSQMGIDLKYGAMARGVSADGRVVYGSEWDFYGSPLWIDGELVGYVGEDVTETEEGIVKNENGDEYMVRVLSQCIMQAQNSNMSPNGKYIACPFKKAEIKNFKSTSTTYPAYYDVEQRKTTVLWDYPDKTATTMSDDGILYIGSPAAGMSSGSVYDTNTQIYYTMQEWFIEKYDLVLNTNLLVDRVCDDGLTLRGSEMAGIGLYNDWFLIPPSAE